MADENRTSGQKESTDRYTSMKNCNLVISVIFAVFGIVVTCLSFQLGFGLSKSAGIKSGTWPGIMGMGMILVSVIIFIYTLANAEKLGDTDFQDEKGDYPYRVSIHLPENLKAYEAMGMIILFCVLMQFLGLYIAGLIIIPMMMWFLMPQEEKADRKKAVLRIIVIDAGTMLAIFLIFQVALHTTFPAPFWA